MQMASAAEQQNWSTGMKKIKEDEQDADVCLARLSLQTIRISPPPLLSLSLSLSHFIRKLSNGCHLILNNFHLFCFILLHLYSPL
jgi:hypothetical protein